MQWVGPIFLILLLSVSSDAELLKNCQKTQAEATCGCIVNSQNDRIFLTEEQLKEEFHENLVKKCDAEVQQKKTKMDRLETCYRTHSTTPDCKTQMDSWRQDVRKNWAEMRLTLAVGRPPLLDPHATGNKLSWFNPNPARPFDGAPTMQPLQVDKKKKIDEVNDARIYFLKSLGKADSKFANIENKLKPDDSLLIDKPSQEPALSTAMTKVRAEALARFYVLIANTPLLEFVTAVDLSDSANPNSPSDEEMAHALFLANTHMKLKKSALKGGTPAQVKKALQDDVVECLKMRSVIEATVVEHPEVCSVAQAEVDAADAAAKRKALWILGAEVLGTAAVTAIACATGVLCLPALAVATTIVSTYDISSAVNRSKDANNLAITDTAIGGKSYSEQKGPSEYGAAGKAHDAVGMSVALAAANTVSVGVKGLTKAGVIGTDGAGNSFVSNYVRAKNALPTSVSSKEYAAADEAISPVLESLPKAKQTSILTAYHEAIQRGRHSADDIANVIKEKLGACERQK